ncbi:SDR family oxidoreductase [Melioribacter sp. Ez-97]|uniref:SDR family oxidoreductase n=1 Tax=Melioribacter sp. Ez-97 TaxID=3423434 RepID=UPI003ED9DA40
MKELKEAVWITGASSGIGKELALEFANKNHTVVATARRLNLLEALEKENSLIKPSKLDVSDFAEVDKFYKEFSSKYKFNVLINNAGLTSFEKAENDSIETIKKIIEVNLLGSIYTIKSVLPDMIERKEGTIINILSVVTKKIFKNSSAYSASKTGLYAYLNVLREEVRKYNIRIINVIPGATKTPIWDSAILEKYSHRMMPPKEIASLVYDLAIIKSNIVTEEIVLRPKEGDLE